MPRTADRDRVLELLAGGAQLVEVPPKKEFDEEHLPHAIHLPLDSLNAGSAEGLDRTRPVVVYCRDAL